MRAFVARNLRLLFFPVLAFLFVAASPALADVACVQDQLTRLGFDPGPIDGELGNRTISAAHLFAKNASLTLDALTTTNSNEWCTAISTFAASPAARNIVTLDLSSEPAGILSDRDQKRLWEAYSTAPKCFDHPTYGEGRPLIVPKLTSKELGEESWTSPYTAVRGAAQCQTSAGSLVIPRPITTVRLDEAYGERQHDVDIAATWFRRLTTYLRLSDDPVVRTQLKQGIIEWARAGGLGKGIHVSWGAKPVDYQMMAAILSILSATAEVARDFSPEERAIVGPWLNALVAEMGASHWKDRSDNKAYMRTYAALIWGLMVGDDRPVEAAIEVYKLAIHDMRPDGSWPIDSQRGGMGLHYNSGDTAQIVLIATALKLAREVDLFSYAVDGRSVHTAVEFVLRSIKDPVATNRQYAIKCPEGGDRFGSVDNPSMSFVEEAGYLTAYANLFPETEASRYILNNLASEGKNDSEKSGGVPACLFALTGGEVNLAPLAMPEAAPPLPTAKHSIRTLEDIAHEVGRSVNVNSLLTSQIAGEKDGVNELDFNVVGTFSYPASSFFSFSLVINEPLGKQRPDALAQCGAKTRTYDDNRHRVVIEFTIDGTHYKARNADCIIAALPKRQAFEAQFLLDSFADVGIGLVASGDIENLRHEGLKTFFKRVAVGEIVVSR
jgi:hypothetical protein